MHSKYFRAPTCITLFIKVLSLLMALQSNVSMARNTALLQTPLKDLANQYVKKNKILFGKILSDSPWD